jgi:phenylacetate-CoA ligase
MVVTTLRKEAAPLIRYRTRDLVQRIDRPCTCGSVLPLHGRILGRSDDMIIFRGVNIYPGQFDQMLSQIPGASCEYQVLLRRESDGKDYMTLRVECQADAPAALRADLSEKIADAVKKQIMVGCRVHMVDYGSLPRSERKSKRIFDERGV